MERVIQKYKKDIKTLTEIKESVQGRTVYDLGNTELLKVIEALRTELSMDDDSNWIESIVNQRIESMEKQLGKFEKTFA